MSHFFLLISQVTTETCVNPCDDTRIHPPGTLSELSWNPRAALFDTRIHTLSHTFWLPRSLRCTEFLPLQPC